MPDLPPDGASFFRPAPSAPAEGLMMIGYPLVAGLAIRADVLESLSQNLEPREGARRMNPVALAKEVGCSPSELLAVARAFGHAIDKPGRLTPPRRRRRRRRSPVAKVS
jgi:hypothetical protein